MEKTIEISIDEYRVLFEKYAQINVIKRLVEADEYLNNKELRLILGMEEEKEDEI